MLNSYKMQCIVDIDPSSQSRAWCIIDYYANDGELTHPNMPLLIERLALQYQLVFARLGPHWGHFTEASLMERWADAFGPTDKVHFLSGPKAAFSGLLIQGYQNQPDWAKLADNFTPTP